MLSQVEVAARIAPHLEDGPARADFLRSLGRAAGLERLPLFGHTKSGHARLSGEVLRKEGRRRRAGRAWLPKVKKTT